MIRNSIIYGHRENASIGTLMAVQRSGNTVGSRGFVIEVRLILRYRYPALTSGQDLPVDFDAHGLGLVKRPREVAAA